MRGWKPPCLSAAFHPALRRPSEPLRPDFQTRQACQTQPPPEKFLEVQPPRQSHPAQTFRPTATAAICQENSEEFRDQK
jgi:hypothetical protein